MNIMVEIYEKRQADLEDRLVECSIRTPEYNCLISEYNRLSVLIAKLLEKAPSYRDSEFRRGYKYY